jgi:hypothetical protein
MINHCDFNLLLGHSTFKKYVALCQKKNSDVSDIFFTFNEKRTSYGLKS